jgi:hypothetical protein
MLKSKKIAKFFNRLVVPSRVGKLGVSQKYNLKLLI